MQRNGSGDPARGPKDTPALGPGDCARYRDRGHVAAVVSAEARLLEHALAPWDIITVEALSRRVRAHQWHQGSFDAALRTAIEHGLIELRPFGFVRLRRD
jgi:hypothetical protein